MTVAARRRSGRRRLRQRTHRAARHIAPGRKDDQGQWRDVTADRVTIVSRTRYEYEREVEALYHS
ncbi:hypothetical protein ACFWN1_30145 [Streptomyces sp. NPDC058459]|uniref:hypothetical protein n=1 Tax=Streptomyces sp. NPDC058459 TaxID=3346508 RepID=UPI00364CE48E